MSGYGYHAKGIPLWLINEIKLIKKKSSCLSIFFHEININKNFWNPYFIIMIIQKYIAIQLLKNCNYWVTSNVQYSDWLKKYSFGKKNYICPIPSLINHKLKKVKKNKKIMILFGTSSARAEIYKNYFYILEKWIIKNDLVLYDVGPKIEDKHINNLIKDQNRIKIFGKVSSLKVSKLLSKAYFGVFSRPHSLINKSTVFATYCKYKVCPINLENFNENIKKRLKEKNYLHSLPYKNSNKKISNICNINFRLSKKNNIENYIKIILKNF